jgi:hypothetical protein
MTVGSSCHEVPGHEYVHSMKCYVLRMTNSGPSGGRGGGFYGSPRNRHGTVKFWVGQCRILAQVYDGLICISVLLLELSK